jgi:hypothetical protein
VLIVCFDSIVCGSIIDLCRANVSPAVEECHWWRWLRLLKICAFINLIGFEPQYFALFQKIGVDNPHSNGT